MLFRVLPLLGCVGFSAAFAVAAPPQSQKLVQKPITLYRDTNGWCPFCEKVMLALEAKSIEYDSVLINLRDKPKWYTDMVPTALVPSIAVGDDIIWESDTILERLEQEFPSPCMQPPEGAEELAELCKAGYQEFMTATFSFAGYNMTDLTEGELQARRAKTEAALDKLDKLLGKADGPFFTSDCFTSVDASCVPMLERMAVQMPLTTGLCIRGQDRWPNLNRWFDALEEEVPSYRSLIKGDEESWTRALPAFAKLFSGSAGLSPRSLKAIERAEEAISRLEAETDVSVLNKSDAWATEGRKQALEKLCSNEAMVAADALKAAGFVETRDEALELCKKGQFPEAGKALAAVKAVLAGDDWKPLCEKDAELVGAGVVRAVRRRLCVPRDMGSLAGEQLRAACWLVAGELS